MRRDSKLTRQRRGAADCRRMIIKRSFATEHSRTDTGAAPLHERHVCGLSSILVIMIIKPSCNFSHRVTIYVMSQMSDLAILTLPVVGDRPKYAVLANIDADTVVSAQ